MWSLKELFAGDEGDELHFHAINDCLNPVMIMVLMIALTGFAGESITD